MNEQWQNKLRDQFAHHDELAPEGLWEGIEKGIVTNSSMQVGRNKKRMWLISTAAAAAVAILLLLLLPLNTESTIDIIPTESIVSTQPVITAEQTNNNLIAITQPQPIEYEIIIGKSINDESPKISVVDKPNETVELALNEKTIESEENVENISSENDDKLLAISTSSQGKQSKWQTNLSMSNIPSSSSETHTGFGTFAQQETVEDQYAFMSQYTREETYTEINHNLPITVGLSLRYSINQRWGVSSGLTYSLLSSKLRSESINFFYDDRQTLHYLGVPLNIDYKLWQNSNLSIYFSAGGLVEKNIAGKLSSDYYIDNKLQSSTNEKISSKHLQWSVNSAIGLAYRISDNIGIYAEPGIAYYFKNNSELETIYKERPFNFNLRIGLRININD